MDWSDEGEAYGVQVRSDAGGWYFRYGWFSKHHDIYDERDPLERARESRDYALNVEKHPAARIVKRTLHLEVVPDE